MSLSLIALADKEIYNDLFPSDLFGGRTLCGVQWGNWKERKPSYSLRKKRKLGKREGPFGVEESICREEKFWRSYF